MILWNTMVKNALGGVDNTCHDAYSQECVSNILKMTLPSFNAMVASYYPTCAVTNVSGLYTINCMGSQTCSTYANGYCELSGNEVGDESGTCSGVHGVLVSGSCSTSWTP